MKYLNTLPNNKRNIWIWFIILVRHLQRKSNKKLKN